MKQIFIDVADLATAKSGHQPYNFSGYQNNENYIRTSWFTDVISGHAANNVVLGAGALHRVGNGRGKRCWSVQCRGNQFVHVDLRYGTIAVD